MLGIAVATLFIAAIVGDQGEAECPEGSPEFGRIIFDPEKMAQIDALGPEDGPDYVVLPENFRYNRRAMRRPWWDRLESELEILVPDEEERQEFLPKRLTRKERRKRRRLRKNS